MTNHNLSHDAPSIAVVPLPKVSSGIAGLDEVLDGGYPEHRTTMVRGGPGAGKSLVCLQFLVNGAQRGIPGILITFEEGMDAVRANAATLGWDLAALEEAGLLFLYHAKIDFSAVRSGTFSLQGLLTILGGKATAMGATRVVVDALDVLMRRFDNHAQAWDEANALHEWVDANQMTTLLTVKLNDELDPSKSLSQLDYVCDCVLNLDHRVTDQISTRRLRVLKYRGSGFGSNEYPYVIGVNGISFVPIGSGVLAHKALGRWQSSGVATLDAALCGGFRQSSCVLIAGSSGSGKTTLASTFVAAACARGERVLFISFEESAEALESALNGCGVHLRAAVDSDGLRFICTMPESKGSDQHLLEHLAMIGSFAPQHVVVDALSACHRMGSGKAAFDYCLRLVTACKEGGITCLLTNQTSGAATEDLTSFPFLSLVDTVLDLRLRLEHDQLARTITVVKARGSDHSHRVHDLWITDNGLQLAARDPAGPGEPGTVVVAS